MLVRSFNETKAQSHAVARCSTTGISVESVIATAAAFCSFYLFLVCVGSCFFFFPLPLYLAPPVSMWVQKQMHKAALSSVWIHGALYDKKKKCLHQSRREGESFILY